MNNIKPIWIVATIAGAMSLAIAGYVGVSHFSTVRAANEAATAAAAAPRIPPTTTLPAGTRIAVRLNESVSSRRAAGSTFSATVSEPVVIDGQTVIPRGAQATGVVIAASASGRLKGRAHVALALSAVDVQGKSYRVETRTYGAASSGHKKRNWLAIGGTSGAGALIGGLAAGPAGMAIGAGSGAGAGTIFAAATGKKSVTVPAETRISFSLRDPVEMQVPRT